MDDYKEKKPEMGKTREFVKREASALPIQIKDHDTHFIGCDIHVDKGHHWPHLSIDFKGKKKKPQTKEVEDEQPHGCVLQGKNENRSIKERRKG